MFDNLQLLPLDPIFKLQAEFLADENPKKVNLGIGLYSSEKGQPVVLNTVKQAFSYVDTSNFDYQPISGNKQFLSLTASLVFGTDALNNSLAMQATCGGTQALRLFADLVALEHAEKNIPLNLVVGLPTWSNQLAIFKDFKQLTFNHLSSNGLASYENYLEAITNCPDHSVLMLHSGYTHNPSGQNLSTELVLTLAPLINQKNLKVFIDAAYFGFGDSFENESANFTTLFAALDNFALGFSFSKNASLYEHRTGALFAKTDNPAAVNSQLQQLARESISMAPGLGQEIMTIILSDPVLRESWQQEVDEIRTTLDSRKQLLCQNLNQSFQHLVNAKGMFGLLPFTEEQIQTLKTEYSIYIPKNGRINFAGVNPGNIDYIIQAFQKV